MDVVASRLLSELPLKPPSSIIETPPETGEVKQGWLKNSSGNFVHSGAHGCPECGGGYGLEENECSDSCSWRCYAAPSLLKTASTPSWGFVGLWPAQAYDKLGLVDFFAAARSEQKLPKKKRTEAAVEVCWSYCLGSETFPSHKFAPLPPDLDGVNYDRFIGDFSRIFGPGREKYPGSAALVEVTKQSRQLLDPTFTSEDPTDGFNFSSTSSQSSSVAGEFDRKPLGSNPTEVFDNFKDRSNTCAQRARILVASEYWQVLGDIMPRGMIVSMEKLLGGKKKAAAIHAEYSLIRLKAAATFDRTSRLLEYEEIRSQQMAHEANLREIRAARQATKGEAPSYPDDDLLHAFPIVIKFLEQDRKIWKSKCNTWRSKCQQTLLQARVKSEDGLMKAISAVEKLGVKTSKAILRSRLKASEKWEKEERKKLDVRCKQFHKVCSELEFSVDINKDNVKYSGWYADYKLSTECASCLEELEHHWKLAIEKIRSVDFKARRELMAVETELLERVKAAREPNIDAECKAYEKRMKKSNFREKGYKFDWHKGEAVEFLKKQEQIKAAHARWFDEMMSQLRDRHTTIEEEIDSYYRNLFETVFPLHTFDHAALVEWAPDDASTASLNNRIKDRSEKKARMEHMTFDSLEPNPVPLLDLCRPEIGCLDNVDENHPAVVIMKAKMESGEISESEYKAMLRVHSQMVSLTEESGTDMPLSQENSTADLAVSLPAQLQNETEPSSRLNGEGNAEGADQGLRRPKLNTKNGGGFMTLLRNTPIEPIESGEIPEWAQDFSSQLGAPGNPFALADRDRAPSETSHASPESNTSTPSESLGSPGNPFT